MSIFVGRDSYPASFGASFGAAGLKGKASFGPAYLADFLLGTTSHTLPSGVSVSSPSLGGLVTDSTGRLTYKGNNLALNTATIGGTGWNVRGGTTAVVNGALAPDGTATASLITQSSGDGYIYYSPTVVAGCSYIISIYARKQSGSPTIAFNAYDGGTASSTTAVSISDTYTQYYLPFTATNSTSGGDAGFKIVGGSAAVYGFVFAAVTYETAPRPQDQVVTTAQAYYGPAWDYDPVNVGVPLGLRIWEARTNLVKYSTTMTNAAWAVYLGTLTNDGTLAPDGVSSMIKTTPSSGAGTRGIFYQVASNAITSGSNYVYSAYVKPAGGNYVYISAQSGASDVYAVAVFDLSSQSRTTATQTTGGATSGTIVSTSQTYVGNGVYRIAVVANMANSQVYFNIGAAVGATGQTITSGGLVSATYAGTESYYCWGAQQELGSFVGPLIPTGSGAGVGVADVVTLTGTALSTVQGAAWSMVEEFAAFTTAGQPSLFNTSPSQIGSFSNLQPGNVNWYNAGAGLGSYTLGTTVREAQAWSGGSFSGVMAGGSVATGAGDFTNTGVTGATIGSYAGTHFIDGYVRKLALYTKRLPDPSLQYRTNSGVALNG